MARTYACFKTLGLARHHFIAIPTDGAKNSPSTVRSETASNEGATGRVVSTVFALPTWQAKCNVPAPSTSTGGRGVSDVAGDADPTTGYNIRVDGQTIVIGGTSAVAPLWVGLIAVANQQLGRTVGFIPPAIYAAKATSAFHDDTQGNNDSRPAPVGTPAPASAPFASKLIPLLAPASSRPTTSSTPPAKPVKKHKKPVKTKMVSKKAAK